LVTSERERKKKKKKKKDGYRERRRAGRKVLSFQLEPEAQEVWRGAE
jgi:hypothetical protein